MATKAQLRDQVLEYLGKKRIGQTASNEQVVDITQAIDEVYADLQTDQLMTFAEDGAIPNHVLPHIKALVAFRRSSGLSQERYQRLLGDVGQAKREIRRIIAPVFANDDEPDEF